MYQYVCIVGVDVYITKIGRNILRTGHPIVKLLTFLFNVSHQLWDSVQLFKISPMLYALHSPDVNPFPALSFFRLKAVCLEHATCTPCRYVLSFDSSLGSVPPGTMSLLSPPATLCCSQWLRWVKPTVLSHFLLDSFPLPHHSIFLTLPLSTPWVSFTVSVYRGY